MDNNAFEKSMINAVNANAKAATEAREAQMSQEFQKWVERRKAQRLRAIFQAVCWLMGFVTILVAIGLLNWMGYLPGSYSIAITGMAAFVAGGKVFGLVNWI